LKRRHHRQRISRIRSILHPNQISGRFARNDSIRGILSPITFSYMIEYKVIREIELNPSHTQRSLAEKLDISLGKVNYVLAGLIEKGIIKAKKLKNNPENIRWQYILTSEGVREKIKITKNYLARRIVEFENLQKEIELLKKDVRNNG
jgi:EPS-associated MarR family transcriptional regulator